MQTLITSSSRNEWTKKVNEYLEEGWTVVPGTLCITNSVSRDEGSSHYAEAYACVVECKDEKLC